MGKDARIRELECRVAQLEAMVESLLAENARLRDEVARLKKNSKTSSKPPSSDIVSSCGCAGQAAGKPGRPRKKRSIGGQPGHDKHTRTPFAPGRIDESFEYEWSDVGEDWQPLDDYYILQQVELRDCPLLITEHRFRRYRHRKSGRIVNAPVPDALRHQGLFGARLRAFAAMLKGDLHASVRGIQRLFADALHVPVSTGYLSKVIRQTGEALAAPYDELCAALPTQSHVGMDETGHPDRGKRWWTWCATTADFTVFRIADSRGSQVIRDLLGENYSGILLSDYFSAYRKFVGERSAVPAYCWAHLIRDIRYLTTLSDKVTKNWAMKLIDEAKRLFKTYHAQGKRAQHNAKAAILARVRHPPPRGDARTLADRVRTNAEAYFRFLEDDQLEPTNNATERALRHAVLTRKMTQGTRGAAGRQWCERLWTARETCRQRGRDLFGYLAAAIEAHTQGQPTPSLIA
jgi:transposase